MADGVIGIWFSLKQNIVAMPWMQEGSKDNMLSNFKRRWIDAYQEELSKNTKSGMVKSTKNKYAKERNNMRKLIRIKELITGNGIMRKRRNLEINNAHVMYVVEYTLQVIRHGILKQLNTREP